MPLANKHCVSFSTHYQNLHGQHCEELKCAYLILKLDEGEPYVHGKRIFTSAIIGYGTDLVIKMIEGDSGTEWVVKAARILVVRLSSLWRSSTVSLTFEVSTPGWFGSFCVHWLDSESSCWWSVSKRLGRTVLARQWGMSEWAFYRRFKRTRYFARALNWKVVLVFRASVSYFILIPKNHAAVLGGALSEILMALSSDLGSQNHYKTAPLWG